MIKRWMALAMFVLLGMQVTVQAEPKHLLVVTTTLGFRHSSIETGEKVMKELAAKTGEFTVDFASVSPNDPQYQGADGKPSQEKITAAIRAKLAEKLNPTALQQLDGVVFLNTTGTLPIPDVQAFLQWIKDGHAFMGMHSASDTMHGESEASDYTRMLNGEFRTHGPQETVTLHNVDAQHAATSSLPSSVTVHEEMYLFKNYERSLAHSLLNMDQHPNERTPGHYPVSWCRSYGQGRVFYTSLGHREDIWDPQWKDGNGKRENPPEVAVLYQQHILGGMRWALGLAPGDSTPQQP